ncbi:ATP-binding protein [Streptomyces sp. NPDC055036]
MNGTVARCRRPRDRNLLETSFDIAERGEDEDVPEQDAQRVAYMRRVAMTRMSHCGLDAMADDVALVVSELVTNAIKHSCGTHVTVELRLVRSVVRISVRDDTPGLPEIREPASDAESGRGLILVQGIADQYNGSWGTSSDGTTTWCALTIRSG